MTTFASTQDGVASNVTTEAKTIKWVELELTEYIMLEQRLQEQ